MQLEIEKIFGSKIRAKLLAWLYMHPDERFFVRQLSNILKGDSTNISRELSNLEKAGILSSAKESNLKYFCANEKCPFFNELKGLVLKTVGVIGVLKSSLQNFQGIKFAFVYGSYARGEEKTDSDVDLMIIGNIDFDSLDLIIDDIEKKIGRSMNYITYDYKEFANKRKTKDGFIIDVLKDKKIMLIGNENDLKKA